MNKSQLIEQIEISADLTKAKAADALNATTDAITEALKSGEQVQLVNFATFKVSHRAERRGGHCASRLRLSGQLLRWPGFYRSGFRGAEIAPYWGIFIL